MKEKQRNQSEFERQVGIILERMFPHYPIYTQYPYYDILTKGYKWHPGSPKDSVLLKKGKRLKADFCILDLFLIIECNGPQHYRPTIFGRGDNPITRFYDQQRRDKDKRLIANEAQFDMIELEYGESISEERLWQEIERKREQNK